MLHLLLRSVIFQRDPELDLRRSVLTRYMNRARRPLHRIGQAARFTEPALVPLKPLSFQERYPRPRPVEGIFLLAAKR
jgi:hypothetical protein